MAPQKHAANAMEIDRLATQLAKDPHSKAFLPLAEEYCKVGMWEEAVSVLEAGLKQYPGFITAMVVLGRAYDQLNQATKARAVLEGAIKLSPENLRAHRTLMRIYAAQGLRQEAMKSCRVILSMNPKDEEALSVQASVGGEEPEPARETLSPRTSSAVGQEPQPAPAVTNVTNHPDATDNSLRAPMTGDLQPESAASVERAAGHAATIAQLESWLRSLERQRRDRPTSGSNP
ncbi:MAG TPA: tetratricopeptide repeat protein [Nitrospira sp.]|nr:tetratricopeptide repeat protein [Nitrospira sp.]